MRTIIMAQGENSRWRSRNGKTVPDVSRKHMLPIGKYGAPILGRTKVQLICHSQPISEVFSIAEPSLAAGYSGVYMLDDPGISLLEGLKQTRSLWAERTLILLGDVVFSHSLIDIMVDDKAALRFYGRVGPNPVTGKAASELFGMVFTEEWEEQVYDHCVWMTSRGRPVKYPPKLWALYRLMAGFEHDEYQYEDQILHRVDDFTDDIDSIEEYRQFYDKLNTAAAVDDDSCWCEMKRHELFPYDGGK